MVERHQDYLLTVPSVPVGGVRQIPLRLDADAPFALRLVRSRNIEIGLADEPLVGWKFTDPNTSYQSSDLRTDWIVPAFQGFPEEPSRGSIIYPEFVYPPLQTIYVDIGNPLNVPIANAQLLFRGSKLFQRDSSTYPDRFSAFPAVYQVIVQNVPPVGQILNNTLTIKNTADFVYRYGVCDAFLPNAFSSTPTFVPPPLLGQPATNSLIGNVTIQLKDEFGKFYSNAPIHVNDLFGEGFSDLSDNPNQGTQDDSVLFTPGLVTPEIYIPRRHNFYFDIYRDDPGGQTVDLYFRFGGMGVYPR